MKSAHWAPRAAASLASNKSSEEADKASASEYRFVKTLARTICENRGGGRVFLKWAYFLI